MFTHTMIAFFIALSVVLVSICANLEVDQERHSHDRFRAALKRAAKAANLHDVEVQSIPIQANLRTIHEESRFIQGYFYFAEYSGSTCDDADFKALRILKLNDCIPATDRAASRKFRGWITAKGNLGLTTNQWEDDECKVDWEKEDDYYPNNTCFDGVKIWFGPLPENPLPFLAGSVGFYQIPDNRKCLDSKDPSKDFYFAEFYRMGTCIEYDPDDPYRDSMITGCSETSGVNVRRYYSEDGTCTDDWYPRLYNPRNVCVWYDIYWDGNFAWTKYECY